MHSFIFSVSFSNLFFQRPTCVGTSTLKDTVSYFSLFFFLQLRLVQLVGIPPGQPVTHPWLHWGPRSPPSSSASSHFCSLFMVFSCSKASSRLIFLFRALLISLVLFKSSWRGTYTWSLYLTRHLTPSSELNLIFKVITFGILSFFGNKL